MKKILSLVLVVALCLSLGACNKGGQTKENTPSVSVSKFLDGFKANDAEAIKATYSGDNFDVADLAGLKDGSESEKAIAEALIGKILDFDYTISDEKITEDTAIVEVKFNTFDLGKVMQNFITDYMNKVISQAANGLSEDEIEKKAIESFKKYLDKAKKDFSETVSLPLTKVDGKWMIDAIDETSNIINVLSGNNIELILKLF